MRNVRNVVMCASKNKALKQNRPLLRVKFRLGLHSDHSFTLYLWPELRSKILLRIASKFGVVKSILYFLLLISSK